MDNTKGRSIERSGLPALPCGLINSGHSDGCRYRADVFGLTDVDAGEIIHRGLVAQASVVAGDPSKEDSIGVGGSLSFFDSRERSGVRCITVHTRTGPTLIEDLILSNAVDIDGQNVHDYFHATHRTAVTCFALAPLRDSVSRVVVCSSRIERSICVSRGL